MGRPCTNLTGVLVRKEDYDLDTKRKGRMKTQDEGSHTQARVRDLGRNQPCRHPRSWTSNSRIVKIKFLLFKPASLWYLVIIPVEN